ncbi:hypothetical protein ACH4CE_34800 [Streptomyces gelaticus]|uniref:hypothetical protein n=1 Tax=Streptomyces gelaticus TaxID=285446 RepID=UPI0037A05015
MTTLSAPEPVPVPIRVLLPGDQEVVAHLWSRRQVRDGWRYEVGLPAYSNGPNRMNCTECNIPHVAATLDTAGRAR